MRMPDPNDPRWWWAGCLVAACILVGVLVARARPVPAPRMGLHEVVETGVVVHVPPEAPCTVDRVRLACDRWADAGWPRCSAQPTGGRVRLVVYDGPDAGAAAEDAIGVCPACCGADDPTIEHGIGHALYDLAHVARTGAVMCSTTECAGLDMPRRDR